MRHTVRTGGLWSPSGHPLSCDLGQGPDSPAPVITSGALQALGPLTPCCAQSPSTGTDRGLEPSPLRSSAGRERAFLTTGHLGIGVLLQMGIQHGITDLVTDLVCTRMNMCENHRNIR